MNQKTITNIFYADFSFTNHSLYVLYYKKGAFVHSDSFKKIQNNPESVIQKKENRCFLKARLLL